MERVNLFDATALGAPPDSEPVSGSQRHGAADDIRLVMSSEMSGSVRIADRLAAARRSRFVGRQEEIDLFRSALLADDRPFLVLHLHGPGGVGKSTLVDEYASLAAEAGVPAYRLNGRDIDPSPAGFLLALRAAMVIGEDRSPFELFDQEPRSVLLLDSYDTLAPLDAWLREVFLPRLPAQTLTVLAGRNAPMAAWRIDAGWSELARTVSLRNLPPDDCRSYLQARGVPASQHAAALALTHGHPLALALVADLLDRGEGRDLTLESAPDVVSLLLERFVERVPSPVHRQALAVCARARVTTQALLADVFGTAAAADLFEWLHGLSFVERGPEGLSPHDLVREVLDADLRWRDPEGFRALHSSVLRSLTRRLRAREGREQQRAYFDLVYLTRNNPHMRPYYDWKAMGTAYADPATPADIPTILAIVDHHEGMASARIAEYWLRRQPEAFLAFRSSGQQVIGLMANLLLDEAAMEECNADPAIAAAWRFIQQSRPLRPGEYLMHHRFWMNASAYQDITAATLAAAVAGARWLTTSGLAWSISTAAEPDFWAPVWTVIGFQRARDADFEVGGRRYGAFAHDWRVESPLAWIERKGLLEFTIAPAPPNPGMQKSLVVLSRPDFEKAVRQALRDYTRPAALATNPLLRSRVAVEHAGGTATATSLQELLREGAATLHSTPRDEKLYRALHRTYLQPAATQELAAESLGLPFSTYRYHLTIAITRLTEWLWQRELSEPED